MDGGEEESVKWSERDVFVRKEDEKSGCIDIHSAEKTGFKHGCSVYRKSLLFLCWTISLALVVISGILLLCIVKTNHRNQYEKPMHSKLSSEQRTGDNSVCVPCQGKELFGTASYSFLSNKLCCTNSQSLNTLMKLLVGQSKDKGRKEWIKERPIINAGSQINNFTVPSSGLYSVYFHLIIRVPTNYNSSKCSVKISVLDKSSSRVLSQGVLLEKPLPTGGYESVVLFETVRLLRGSYDVHIDVSDDELLYRYPGSTGITVYKI